MNKKVLVKYIREQIELFFEEETEVDPVERIKSKEDELRSSEEELENTKQQQKNSNLQIQNKQKVVSTQVGTMGDPQSKSIKTSDVKKDIELYKKQKEELRKKEEEMSSKIELQKKELDSMKADVASGKSTSV
ncbi:MAG: hypothetical protein WC466_03300 [Candidatus Izemoplasmatales bacterium]